MSKSGAKRSNTDIKKDKKLNKDKDKKKEKKTLAQAERDRKKKFTQVAVIVFAVIMALAMMLPSFAAIFSSVNTTNQDQEAASQNQQDSQSQDSESNQASDTSSSDASSDSSSSSDTSTSSDASEQIAAIDSSFQAQVAPLEEKLASNNNDLAALLNLGNDYMSWGYTVGSYARVDADTSHANELFSKAMDYYDRYLALNDSNTVHVNRALCLFYSGDTSAAAQALEEMTQGSAANFGPAWANLGLVRETTGDTDAAREAYEKAKETDPQNDYGAKSFAEARLSSLDAVAQSSANTQSGTDSTTGQGTASGVQGLSSALSNATGLGF